MSKYTPLYDRRLTIIAGKTEPTEGEIEAGQNADSDDEEEEEDEEEGARIAEVKDEKSEGEEKKVDGIPEFWLTALKNHAPISDTITDRDEEVSLRLVSAGTVNVADEYQGLETSHRHPPFIPR